MYLTLKLLSAHHAVKDGTPIEIFIYSRYDCPECHEEANPDHELLYIKPFTRYLQEANQLICVSLARNAKKYSAKTSGLNNLLLVIGSHYEEADEFCPNCDNHYVIEAKVVDQGMAIQVEGEDARIMRDFRQKQRYLMAEDVLADVLG